MLGLIYRLIIGRFTQCQHHWEIIEKQELDQVFSFDTTTPQWKRYGGVLYHLQCKHCGDLKGRHVKL